MARPIQTVGELTKQKPIAKTRTGRVVGGKGNSAVVRFADGSTQKVETSGAVPQSGATVRIDASDPQKPVLVSRGQFLGGAAASAMAALFGASSGTLTAHPLNSGYHTGTLDPAQAPWALNKAGDTLTGNIAANAGVTLDGVDLSVFNAASFLTLGVSSAIPNEQVFTPNATLTGTPGGAGGNYTLGINLSNVNTWLALQTFGAGLTVSAGLGTFNAGLTVAAGTSTFSGPVRLTDGQNMRGSTSFASGFTGDGWQIIDSGSKSQAEFDELIVRGTMRVYELIIHKIRAGNGSYLFAPGAKVKAVSGSGPYTIDFDTDHGLAVNDLIRAQKFDLQLGGVYNSQMTVATTPSTTQITATLNSGAAPAVGYEYVRTGNTTDAARRGSIYITSDDTNSPRITIIDGVSTHAEFGASTKVFGNWGRMNGYYGAGATNWGFGVGNYNGGAGNYMRYADDATGFQIKFSGGAFTADANGLGVAISGGRSAAYAYRFTNAQIVDSGLYASDSGTEIQAYLLNTTTVNRDSRMLLAAESPATKGAVVALAVSEGGSTVNDFYLGKTETRFRFKDVTVEEFLTVNKGLGLGGHAGVASGDMRLSSRIEYRTANADGGSYAILGVNAGAGKGLALYDYYNSRAMLRFAADPRQAMFFNSYSSGAMVNIGDATVDYPANTGWAATYPANLLLSGLNYTSISFHDAGVAVHSLRYTNKIFDIGSDLGFGWGTASLWIGGYLKTGQPLVFRGNRSTTQSINSASWTDIDLDTEDTDLWGFTADGVTFTAPAEGVYVISATCRFPAHATGVRGLSIFDQTNSIYVSAQVVPTSGGSDDTRLNICDTVQATNGQQFRVKAYQSSGSPMNIGGTLSNDRLRISMWRVN